MTIKVTIPAAGWAARPHQQQLWNYLNRGGKRAIAVWHRRAGKDEICLHHTCVAALERPGNYWHCLPEYLQARKALWTAINPHTGKRRIDEAFPHAIRSSTNDHEMFLRLVNGSTVQLIGSDNYDSTMGASVAGITYSEWALANPAAWGYHRPMIEENNGFAIFITTPRGNNHAKALLSHAAAHPRDWFSEVLTVDDTGALTPAQLKMALEEYQSLFGADVGRAQFEQEYYCNFNAAILGAFYALEMQAVRSEGRILPIEAEPALVHRAWDLGVKDDTSIWWFQVVGGQILILDHYAASGVGLDHYVDVIERRMAEHGWADGIDFVPHDARVKEWGSGRTRVETMTSMGLHPQLVPDASLQDGINAARRTLPLCVFHPRTEETGIAALEQYRREWDQDKKAFKQSAVHDWTSHPADAFRYLSLVWRAAPRAPVREPARTRDRFIIPPPPEPRTGGIRI